MSRYLTYTWSASNPTDICKSQTLAAAGNLVLNGNLADSTNSAVNFEDYGYSRSITISSTSDLSGVTFTINGTQNGVNINTPVTGPTAGNTVESPDIFDNITSISADGIVADVTVGSGYKGFFKIIAINTERDVINYSFSLHRLTTNPKDTIIFGTLSNIVNNGISYLDITANDLSLFEIKADGPTNGYIFPAQNTGISQQPLYKFILVYVHGDATTAANSIQLNFIQT